MKGLREKVVLITGASRGIGAATALMFAESGAKVAINYREGGEKAGQVAEECRKHGVDARVFRADVARPDECRRLVDEVLDRFRRIDVLVNNAGIWEEAPIDHMKPEALKRLLAVNLESVFHLTGLVVPHMKTGGSGSIINVSSTAGQRGEAFHSHYAASKGALISFTKSMAWELAPSGIRVNCVAPGWVDTDMSHDALVGPQGNEYISSIPLGRAATAGEIAGPIVFLASDYASFVVGEVLNVNGGAVLCG